MRFIVSDEYGSATIEARSVEDAVLEWASLIDSWELSRSRKINVRMIEGEKERRFVVQVAIDQNGEFAVSCTEQ